MQIKYFLLFFASNRFHTFVSEAFFCSAAGYRNPSCGLVKYNLRIPQISLIFVFHFSDCLASFSGGETQAFLSDFDELSRIPKVQHELQKYNTSSHGFRQPASGSMEKSESQMGSHRAKILPESYLQFQSGSRPLD